MTEPLEILLETREFVLVPWGAKVGGVAVDPTDGYTPTMAFTAVGARPAPGDWKAAQWEADEGGGWNAGCLVGTGGTVELGLGTYDVFVKTVGPTAEVPVKQATARVRVV